MDITLKIDGKDKTFTTSFISARMLRRTIEVAQGVNFDNISPEELDKLIDYVVELFANQFTRDDVYDGLASKDLIPTITKCINEVVGQMAEVTSGEGKTSNGERHGSPGFYQSLISSSIGTGLDHERY